MDHQSAADQYQPLINAYVAYLKHIDIFENRFEKFFNEKIEFFKC